jgi:uncharacterized membrane protein YfcA
MVSILIIVIFGAIIGIIGGLLGLPGPLMYLPGLLYLGIVPNYKTAVGTALCTVLLPTTLFAVYEYYNRGQVLVKEAMILAIAFMIFSFFGAYLSKFIKSQYLQIVSGCLTILIGCYLIWSAFYSN